MDYDNSLNRNNNWMYMGLDEWTMVRDNYSDHSAFQILENGSLSSRRVVSAAAVRPCFYLISNVIMTDGTGTITDPYRLS